VDALFTSGEFEIRGRPDLPDADFSKRGMSDYTKTDVNLQQEYDIAQGKLVDLHVEESSYFF
jgi:hypothetical protein